MSNAALQACTDSEELQRRIHALGRQALEGERPLSDLLGEALAELRSALAGIRELEAALEGPEPAPLSALAASADAPVVMVSLAEYQARDAERAAAFAAAPPAAGADRERDPVELFERPAPHGPRALEDSLRARIAGALYLGTLGPGDRLPSIRELARRTGLNHKVVRRAYRAMEQDGVIDVRDRSGIYVASPPRPVDGGLGPTESWVAGVVVEALDRGLGTGALAPLLERSVAGRRLRCACVDSTEDDRFALCHEIGPRLGMETVPVTVDAADSPLDLQGADVVVTTPFHAEEVRRSLSPGQRLVVAILHPAWKESVERAPDDASIRLLCVDRAAGDRIRHGVGPRLAPRVRVQALDGTTAAPADAGTEVFATPAARARMAVGGGAPPVRVPPYLSAETLRELAHMVVALNAAPAD